MQQTAFLSLSRDERKQGGNPLQTKKYKEVNRMRGERNRDRNTRKFISIPDMQKWEQIDELMSMPKYEKSFNKVINEALDYGLPLLLKSEKGEVTYESETEKYDEKQLDLYYRLDELIMEIVYLMEEFVVNETICKSLLCSLFNERVIALKNTANGELLKKGELRDTPEYLEGYERFAIKKLTKRRGLKKTTTQ